jgi:hypothetical protein
MNKDAKINKTHAQKTREKIQGSLIVNKLIDHVLGKLEMSPTQVTAACKLMNKTIPDLKSLELSGDQENPLKINNKWEVEFVSSTTEDS